MWDVWTSNLSTRSIFKIAILGMAQDENDLCVGGQKDHSLSRLWDHYRKVETLSPAVIRPRRRWKSPLPRRVFSQRPWLLVKHRSPARHLRTVLTIASMPPTDVPWFCLIFLLECICITADFRWVFNRFPSFYSHFGFIPVKRTFLRTIKIFLKHLMWL